MTRPPQKVFPAVLVALLFSCSSGAFSQSPVTAYGTLSAIMQRGDLSTQVLLDTVQLSSSAIGLGVASGLKGEIIIVAGTPYRSWVEDGRILTAEDRDAGASMIVFTNGGSAGAEVVTTRTASLEEIANTLSGFLRSHSFAGPVAFLIEANVGRVSYHIIDWRDGVVHTAGNHRQFARSGEVYNEKMILVGFYSTHPAGVFTPHSSPVHIHVYAPSRGIVGHVDSLTLPEGQTIRIF